MKRLLPITLGAIFTLACEVAEPTTPAALSSETTVRSARPVPPTGPTITVTDLGTLPNTVTVGGGGPIASGLNTGATRSQTMAVGYTRYGSFSFHPFAWTASGGIVPLAMHDVSGAGAAANGVSTGGVIVGGTMSTPVRAFSATASGSFTFLPTLSGSVSSYAYGISPNGSYIVGYNSFVEDTSKVLHAVVWTGGTIYDLGVGSAHAVTDDGVVTGATGRPDGRGVVWTFDGSAWTKSVLPAGAYNIGDTVWTDATDISPSGEFISGSRAVNGTSQQGAVWRKTLAGWELTLIEGSIYVFGVDNQGRAVGHDMSSLPTLWIRSSGGQYISYRLPGLDGSSGGWPAAINELGQISGRSYKPANRGRDKSNPGWHPVVWTVD